MRIEPSPSGVGPQPDSIASQLTSQVTFFFCFSQVTCFFASALVSGENPTHRFAWVGKYSRLHGCVCIDVCVCVFVCSCGMCSCTRTLTWVRVDACIRVCTHHTCVCTHQSSLFFSLSLSVSPSPALSTYICARCFTRQISLLLSDLAYTNANTYIHICVYI